MADWVDWPNTNGMYSTGWRYWTNYVLVAAGGLIALALAFVALIVPIVLFVVLMRALF